MGEKTILSVADVSELLQVSASTIYVMIRSNEIPHVKLRGRYLFEKESLFTWLRENVKQPI